jgi:predicted amidophosphoribosyltransferase
VIDFLRTWLFPPACVGCDAPGPALCAACAPQPRDAVAFAVDGVPAFALGPYEGALRAAIVAMKHGARDPLDVFADLLAARAPLGDRADPSGHDAVLVPLPTSRGRATERGFDQSVELARRLAASRGIACADVLVKRGAAQERLGRQKRLAATGRFRIRRGAELPRGAALFDDVCTTGATARDAMGVLREAGVEVRRIVFLARAER